MPFHNGQKIYYLHKRCSAKVVFAEDPDYQFYLRLVNIYKISYSIKLVAFCFFPREFFLVVIPRTSAGLAEYLAKLDEVYLSYFCHRYQDEYCWDETQTSVLGSARELMDVVHDLEFLPVKRGLAQEPALYPWGSCVRRVKGGDGMMDASIADIVDNILAEAKTRCGTVMETG